MLNGHDSAPLDNTHSIIRYLVLYGFGFNGTSMKIHL